MEDANVLRERFASAGQGQVFRFWDHLDATGREALLAQAAEIDLEEVAHLVASHVLGGAEAKTDLNDLEPAPCIARPEHGGDAKTWAKAKELGEEALRAGRVAAFTVAGGQGTRLGYDGPKGTFPVTPVRKKPLFQVFAEKIAAARARYGKPIPWLVMTSHANHAATEAFFAKNSYFGLPSEDILLFMQGRMPAVDLEGKILLSAPGEIAMSPDGHGGSLRALVRSGAVTQLEKHGVDVISYFQVDNPLVHVIDPAFVGFHLGHGSEMSSKMIPKAYPLEKVGHFCVQRGKTVVIEYSDMPTEMQEATDASGELRYNAGSIAIHLLARDFVARAGGGEAAYALPFHRANKKIAVVNDAGETVTPESPNGIKFEMFVFDALPFAQNPVIIETLREDDFSPVKNAEGKDSPETCRDDQLRQWSRWAKAAGIELQTDETGLPDIPFEVSPLFADTEEAFVAKWKALTEKPEFEAGIYLE